MIKRLSLRLAFVYAFVFILAITSIDAVLILSYSKNQFRKTEAVYGQIAGVLSGMVERNIKVASILNLDNEVYAEGINGRILYLDNEGKVLADSMNEYEGRTISNREIRSVLEDSKAASGYYVQNGRNIAMFAYPVGTGSGVNDVILISAYMDEVYRDIAVFRNQVIFISLSVFIIVFIVSILLGERITKPVRKLTKASGEIMRGNLKSTVDIVRNDEIGVLAETFNSMSEELHKIDIGRKRFVSGVSHELRTPLASIKVLIESLLEGHQDEETYKEYLTDINTEIDRLSSLVKSLLTSARLEEVQLKLETALIYNEVEDAIRLFMPIAEQRGIRLENTSERELSARLDREMFREVLVNLIDNGIKYGREGGFLKIGTSAANGRVELLVSDNGIGIGQKDIPLIFENFYRVDEARSRDSGGSGIGLYTVKRICVLHGWEISVTSSAGEGTCFKIIL